MSKIGDAIAAVQAARDAMRITIADAEQVIVELPTVHHHIHVAGDQIAARFDLQFFEVRRAAGEAVTLLYLLDEALKAEEEHLTGLGHDL
jgi:hypothetical protein